MKSRWYEFRAQAQGKAEIWIYEDIGEGFWGDGVAAKTFVPELNAITAAQIDLHINCFGGNVFDGVAIYNALQRHPARVTSYVDAIAASIASVVALAGDEVIMPSNAMMMIHNPMGTVMRGDESAMRRAADALGQLREAMLNVYEAHSTKTREELGAAMDAETWLSADLAQEFGFILEPAEPLDIAASLRPADLSLFRNVPAALLAANASRTPRGPEPPAEDVATRVRRLDLLTRL
jgi:ATP-dependent protease ClpP protease subunit